MASSEGGRGRPIVLAVWALMWRRSVDRAFQHEDGNEGPGGATAGDDRKNEPMDPLSASQSTVCGLAWKRYSRQTPLRDVAPALNGRASLAAAMPNGRCKLHGGKSTGPRTMEGLERSRRANWKHGHFSREAKAERSRLRAAILALRDLCDST